MERSVKLGVKILTKYAMKYLKYMIGIIVIIKLYYVFTSMSRKYSKTPHLENNLEFSRKLQIDDAKIVTDFKSTTIYKIGSNPSTTPKTFILIPIHLSPFPEVNLIKLDYIKNFIDQIYDILIQNPDFATIAYFTGSNSVLSTSCRELEQIFNQKHIDFVKTQDFHKTKAGSRVSWDFLNVSPDWGTSFGSSNIDLAYVLKYISNFSDYSLIPNPLKNIKVPTYTDEKYFMVLDPHYHIPAKNLTELIKRAITNYIPAKTRLHGNNEFMLLNIKFGKKCNDPEESGMTCRLWNLGRAEQLSQLLITSGYDSPLNIILDIYIHLIHTALIVEQDSEMPMFSKHINISDSNRRVAKLYYTYSLKPTMKKIHSRILYSHKSNDIYCSHASSIVMNTGPKEVLSFFVVFDKPTLVSKIYIKFGSSFHIKQGVPIYYKFNNNTNIQSQVIRNIEEYLTINKELKLIKFYTNSTEKETVLYLAEFILLSTNPL